MNSLTYSQKSLAVEKKMCSGELEINMFRLEKAVVNSDMHFPYFQTKFSERQIFYGMCEKGKYGYGDEPSVILELKTILDGIVCKNLSWVGTGVNITNSRTDLGVLYCSDDSSAYWIRIVGSCPPQQ